MIVKEHGLNVMLKVETKQRFFNLVENMRIGVTAEAYSDRNFYSFNFTYGYVYEPHDKIQMVAGIQAGWIIRTDVLAYPKGTTYNHYGNPIFGTVGVNGIIRYYPIKDFNLGIVVYGTLVTRKDISIWGDSLDNSRHNIYGGLTYKF
jgi:hypothetical protein